jgi:hypothetical protein
VSDIIFNNINKDFPVAGQDNDTQVFRDNFDSIKSALSTAKTEITTLENTVARTNQSSDFQYNILTSVTLQDAYLRKKDYGSPIEAGTQEISFKQALYHIVRFGLNCSLSFIEFPSANVNEEGNGQVGKVTLELYGDNTERTITFLTSGSTVIKKSNGFPPLFTVTSSTNPVIIEVWQHNSNTIFLNYVGTFA